MIITKLLQNLNFIKMEQKKKLVSQKTQKTYIEMKLKQLSLV